MPGRKTKYNSNIHPVLAENYARQGLTQQEIAKAMGICLNTFKKWKTLYIELDEALRFGSIPFKADVENRMASMAADPSNRNQFNAMKFILERRFPNQWKEKKEENLHITGDNDDLKRDLMNKMLLNWGDDEDEGDE